MLIVIAGFQQQYGDMEAIKPRLGIWMSIDESLEGRTTIHHAEPLDQHASTQGFDH